MSGNVDSYLVPVDSATPTGVCDGRAGTFDYGPSRRAANCKLINTDYSSAVHPFATPNYVSI